MTSPMRPFETPKDRKNREAIEELAGFRGDAANHALRKGDIPDLDKRVAALQTASREIGTRIAALSTDLQAAQAAQAALDAEIQVALGVLGDIQAAAGALPRSTTRFTGASGESVTPPNDGDVVIELTNPTTLTFKAKAGGVVKTGTVTLT